MAKKPGQLRIVGKSIEVGDNVRMPGCVAKPWGFVELLDGRFARVRYDRGRQTAWWTVADLQRLKDEWLEHQRQRRQRNRARSIARQRMVG